MEVGVELRAEVCHQIFELIDLLLCEQFSTVSAAEPVVRFIQRAATDAHEAAIFRVAAPTVPFRDIGSNAVRRADHLFSHCVPGEGVPDQDNVPNDVSHRLRLLIHPQILKRMNAHPSSLFH